MLAFSQKLGDGYLPCVILLMLILGLKQDGILPLTFVRICLVCLVEVILSFTSLSSYYLAVKVMFR
jgi:hypothetical protein